MPARCCVTGCNSVRKKSVPGLKFFKFPNDETSVERKQLSLERQAAWIKAISRNDVTPLNVLNKTVCAKHFKTGTPAHFKDKANPDWVPNIRMGHKKFASSTIEFEKPQATKSPDPLRQEEIMQEDEYVEIFEDEEKTQTTTAHRLIGQDALETIKLHQPNTNDSATMRQYQIEIEKLKLEKDILQKQLVGKELIIEDQAAEIKTKIQTHKHRMESTEKTIKKLELLKKRQTISIEGLKNDDKKVCYFTGLPSYTVFETIFNFVKGDLTCASNINELDSFIIILLKLRLDLPFTYLGYKYGTTGSTIAEIYHMNLKSLSNKIGPFIRWSDESDLAQNTPVTYFRRIITRKFTALLDFIENPGPESFCYDYKPTKYLIAISPAGAIIFVSKGYDSNLSVKSIAEECGLLDNAEDGDIILAEHGTVAYQVAACDDSKILLETDLVDPMDFQSSEDTPEPNCNRVRTEQILSALKNKFFILTNKQNEASAKYYSEIDVQSDGKCYFDYVVKVCCALINVSPTLLSFDKI